ncbi:MerR family transcriptional regulator [Chlorogloeopsis sp. ULAP02]|uniref:MerR family transcriptional regulator n=1 Tax=Chlorogloeopsis sp. ULAP02 TaxID=3107926 RepID=UPI0031349726
MLKIGDFSKLSQVTVKALRLYDQLGLLKPIYVDEFTSYRYYCAEQLPQLNRILALKDLGFSLEQIARLLNENLPPAEIRGMLRLKQAELQHLVEEEQARLLRVEARLKQIEEESIPKYGIVLKKVEPIKVASIRKIIPNFAAVSRLYDELFESLLLQGIKEPAYCAGIWHDWAYKESDVDWEAVASAESFVSINKRIKVYELPGFEKMACAVHNGSYKTSNQAYTALISWIEANGYKIIAPNREVYIIGGNEQNNESYVTEVQFPVAKV